MMRRATSPRLAIRIIKHLCTLRTNGIMARVGLNVEQQGAELYRRCIPRHTSRTVPISSAPISFMRFIASTMHSVWLRQPRHQPEQKQVHQGGRGIETCPPSAPSRHTSWRDARSPAREREPRGREPRRRWELRRGRRLPQERPQPGRACAPRCGCLPPRLRFRQRRFPRQREPRLSRI